MKGGSRDPRPRSLAWCFAGTRFPDSSITAAKKRSDIRGDTYRPSDVSHSRASELNRGVTDDPPVMPPPMTDLADMPFFLKRFCAFYMLMTFTLDCFTTLTS